MFINISGFPIINYQFPRTHISRASSGFRLIMRRKMRKKNKVKLFVIDINQQRKYEATVEQIQVINCIM